MTPSSDRPALLGGSPAVTLDEADANRWPRFGPQDEAAVLRVLRDGNVSTHPVIRELEAAWSAYTGMPYALAHANGTAALLAAFWTLHLEPGDEVIVPSATFWASALPILWAGGLPVFCESEPDRMGPDPEDIAAKIGPRTRAIVVVHLWGLPARMTEILALAERHDLKVIEDASHAHGALWRGRKCGSLGDMAVFSLQGDKLAPAGEGGVLLTKRREDFEEAVLLGDITRIIELETPDRRFAATSFGVKTRIAPLSAALALAQLEKLDAGNARRSENLRYLSRTLEELGVDTFLGPPHVDRVYFEFLVRIRPDRSPLPADLLIEALRAEGCTVAQPRYPLLHQQPFFVEGAWRRVAKGVPKELGPDYSQVSLPFTERANRELLRLPSFPFAERDLLGQYADAFRKVLGSADELLALRTRTAPAS